MAISIFKTLYLALALSIAPTLAKAIPSPSLNGSYLHLASGERITALPDYIEFVQDFPLDPSKPITSTSTGNSTALEKRSQRPDECWYFDTRWPGVWLPSRSTYFADLQYSYQRLYNSGDFITLAYNGGTAYYRFQRPGQGQGTAWVIVRNQNSCASATVAESTIAYYIRQIMDFCGDEAGWIARAGNSELIFIAEPAGLTVPPYSPVCA